MSWEDFSQKSKVRLTGVGLVYSLLDARTRGKNWKSGELTLDPDRVGVFVVGSIFPSVLVAFLHLDPMVAVKSWTIFI